jgi:hypothetical protein
MTQAVTDSHGLTVTDRQWSQVNILNSKHPWLGKLKQPWHSITNIL